MDQVEKYLENYRLKEDYSYEINQNCKSTSNSYYTEAKIVMIGKERFYRIEIKLPDKNEYHLKIKNFLYIIGPNKLFGGFKSYYQNNEKFIIYLEYYQELQRFMERNRRNEATITSQIIFFLISALEYLYSMDICYRYICQSAVVFPDCDPVMNTFGYSESFLNSNNSLLINEKDENFAKHLYNNNPFPSEVYAFGLLLKSIIKLKRSKNAYLDDLSDRCCSNDPDERPSFSDILKELISIKDPLFKGCQMDMYEEYCKDVLSSIHYGEEIDISDEDPRKLYVFASREINKLNDDIDINNDLFTRNQIKAIKEQICAYLEKAVEKKFLPAAYKYSCFLDSQNEQEDDSIKYMEEVANSGIQIAYYKLGQMYDQIGNHESAKASYQTGKDHNDPMCHLKYLEERIKTACTHNDLEDLEQLKKYHDFNIQRETQIFDAIRHFKGYGCEVDKSSFSSILQSLTDGKDELSGKANYLLAVAKNIGDIPNDIEQNSNRFLAFTNKCDDSCKDLLQKAAQLFYEPAVAEYTILLINENKIQEAEIILQKYFKHARCKHDYSKIRIQYAYAKYLEKKGIIEKNDNIIKKSLRLYKECADKGMPESCIDYINLYSKKENHINTIIKYYTQRAKQLRNKGVAGFL